MSRAVSSPALILHGGAGGRSKDPARLKRLRASLSAILEKSYRVLLRRGARAAALEAVRAMEDDGLYNAGTGSQIQADGRARLSASVMDGRLGRFAGVINLENIRNPVLVAERLLTEKHRLLEGDGALDFALSQGFRLEETRTPDSLRRWRMQKEGGSDTVGACALDTAGRLFSATSTGGLGQERPGRVSDSATPAGNFATTFCAISATGIGEQILEASLASKLAVRAADAGVLEPAFQKTFRELRVARQQMGAIGVDRFGNVAWGHTTPLLIYAFRSMRARGSF